jgi:glycosyltransferase involved in cell wall biosynthesis
VIMKGHDLVSPPRVSMLMATYNGEKFLADAVNGILRQSFEDFEFIIINDGSTDGTAQVLANFRDQRIRVICNPGNLGIGAALNRGLAECRGEFVALQDHDDLSQPDRFGKQVAFLETHPRVGVVGSPVKVIDESGRAFSYWAAPSESVDIKWCLLWGNALSHTSLMIRRGLIGEVGGYSEDPTYRFCEDYEFISRMALLCDLANFEEPLVFGRQHPGSASQRGAIQQQRGAEEVARHNVTWLLGSAVPDTAWHSLRRLPLNWASLSAKEAREAFALYEVIRKAFACRYLDRDSTRRVLRRHTFRMARRALAQARRNPHLDRRCRAVMLRATATLLADVCLSFASAAT